MNSTERKSLLVRADFVLGKHQPADRLIFHRWRRILIDALPHLLRCAKRCPRAEHVCLHQGEAEGRFSAWLRLPIQRRPNRRRLRQLKAKLRSRLEAGLQPFQGEVLKLGVRRCRNKPEVVPLFDAVPVPGIQVVPLSA